MSGPKKEVGAASLHIELSHGNITVYHGTDRTVLAQLQDAKYGTWSAMWEYLELLGIKKVSP